MSHTKEPLTYMELPTADGEFLVLGGDDLGDFGLVASCVTIDDARRIVAAVNACAGIPTDALESGVARQVRDEIEAAVKLEKQRDTLLATLELAFSALESCQPGDYSTGSVCYPSFDEQLVADAYCKAEIAIVSVKGETA